MLLPLYSSRYASNFVHRTPKPFEPLKQTQYFTKVSMIDKYLVVLRLHSCSPLCCWVFSLNCDCVASASMGKVHRMVVT